VRETSGAGGWSARVEELPDCVAHGRSPEDALDRLEEAMRGWIADALAEGREVPKPRSPASHSGRLLVRMPQSMHAALADAAEREETSLNQFINSALASAIGWRRQQTETSHNPGDEQIRRRALVANIVILGLVGLIALVLLAIVVAQKL
jgi:antitoxin HicB